MAAEISTVARLGGLVGDDLVAPAQSYCQFSRLEIVVPSTVYSLAGGLVASKGGLGESLSGLVDVVDGLADDGNTALLVRDNTDGLKISL